MTSALRTAPMHWLRRSCVRCSGGHVARVHGAAEIDQNGERSARLNRYMGKVVAVGNGEFKVDTESQRHSAH